MRAGKLLAIGHGRARVSMHACGKPLKMGGGLLSLTLGRLLVSFCGPGQASNKRGLWRGINFAARSARGRPRRCILGRVEY